MTTYEEKDNRGYNFAVQFFQNIIKTSRSGKDIKYNFKQIPQEGRCFDFKMTARTDNEEQYYVVEVKWRSVYDRYTSVMLEEDKFETRKRYKGYKPLYFNILDAEAGYKKAIKKGWLKAAEKAKETPTEVAIFNLNEVEKVWDNNDICVEHNGFQQVNDEDNNENIKYKKTKWIRRFVTDQEKKENNLKDNFCLNFIKWEGNGNTYRWEKFPNDREK